MAEEPEQPWKDVETPNLENPRAAAFINRAVQAIRAAHPKMDERLAVRHAIDAWHGVHYGFMPEEHAHKTALFHAKRTMEAMQ